MSNDATNATIVSSLDYFNGVKGGSYRKASAADVASQLSALITVNKLGVSTKSTAYTVTGTDGIVNFDTDAAGGIIAATADFATAFWDSTNSKSVFVGIKNTGTTYNLTLARSGSQTIDGGTSITVTPGSGVWLYTDGSNLFTL